MAALVLASACSSSASTSNDDRSPDTLAPAVASTAGPPSSTTTTSHTTTSHTATSDISSSDTSAGAGASTPTGTSTTTTGVPGTLPTDLFSSEPAVFGPGTFDVPEPRTGLDALTSYRATLTVAFAGTTAGKPDEWTTTTVMALGPDASGRMMTVHTSGSNAPSTALLLAERGGASYEQVDDAECSARPIDPQATMTSTYEPAATLAGVIGADVVGTETINGLATTHATFDERAIGGLGVSRSTGELWVARDGRFIVKYVLTSTGGAAMFGASSEGTATWTYEVTDIGAAVAVELPTDCPAGMLTEVPVLPDAVAVISTPGVLGYDSATPTADAAAFYDTALTGLGWSAQPEPSVTDTVVLQEFVRGSEQLSLTISSTNTITSVLLLLGPLQT